MYIFFDTETTGLYDHKKDFDHPAQPHLIQIGAILVSEDLRELATFDTIVRPEGFEIPPDSSAIHGITHDMAVKQGIHITAALNIFQGMCAGALIGVCHNTDFDYGVLMAEQHRNGFDFFLPEKKICTMKSTTNLVGLPGKYGFKWPKLIELHEFLFGEGFSGAHTAIDDIRATVRCFQELKLRGVL